MDTNPQMFQPVELNYVDVQELFIKEEQVETMAMNGQHDAQDIVIGVQTVAQNPDGNFRYSEGTFAVSNVAVPLLDGIEEGDSVETVAAVEEVDTVNEGKQQKASIPGVRIKIRQSKARKQQIKRHAKSKKSASPAKEKKTLKEKKAEIELMRKRRSAKKNRDAKAKDGNYRAPSHLKEKTFEGKDLSRPIKIPSKHSDYLDVEPEYMEEDFILFEDYLKVVDKRKKAEDPRTNAEYLLDEFHMFEKFKKEEMRKEWREDKRARSTGRAAGNRLKRSSSPKSIPFWNVDNRDACNEIQALKYQVMKRMYGTAFRKSGTGVALKMKHVDVPMSSYVFRENFLSLFPEISQRKIGSKRIRCQVSSQALEKVLGKDWHIYRYPASSTQVRVIGNVILLYRAKSVEDGRIFRNFNSAPEDNGRSLKCSSLWLRLSFETVKENVQVQSEMKAAENEEVNINE